MTAILPQPALNGSLTRGTESSMRYQLMCGRVIVITAKRITPREASELLLLNTKNRRQSAETVSRIATAIASNEFMFTGDTIKIVRTEAGIFVLGDGQHRLEAIAKAGIPVDVLIVENIDPKAMSVIDQQRNRKVGDILRMVYEHQSLKNDTIIAGIGKIFMGGYENRFHATKAEIAKYVNTRIDEFQTWASWSRTISDETDKVQMAGRGPSRAMTASPVGALAMFMVDDGADVELVTDFFYRIATGLVSDRDETNVIPAIRKRQKNGTPLVSGGSGGSMTELMSEFSVYIQAYNRWVIGEKVQVIKGQKTAIRSFADLPKVSKFGR